MKKIVFLVGESGSGKTHLADKLLNTAPKVYSRITTTTSREPREGEVGGVYYHFVSDEKFEELVDQGHFLQHVEFGGYRYGTQYDEYLLVPQPIGLFVCTPEGVTDTIDALAKDDITIDQFEIVFFLSSNKLLVEHGTDQERIDRGNLRVDFLDRYIANDFNGIQVHTVCDEFVNDDLYTHINFVLDCDI